MINFKSFVKAKENGEDIPIPTQEQAEPQQQQGEVPQGNELMEKAQDGVSANNPFGGYSNVNMPDVPVSYGGSMADSLLNNEEVPEDIRKRYWPVFHKDNVLTFLDDERKKSKLLNFDIMKIDILNSTPYYDYDFEKELEFGVLRNTFETKLDRALGTKNQIKNERTVLQSQFSEQRQISEMENSSIKEGFWKRLLGRR